jgi:hypothetical protein
VVALSYLLPDGNGLRETIRAHYRPGPHYIPIDLPTIDSADDEGSEAA